MKQLSSALIVSLCLLIMTGTAAAQRLHGAITQWDTAGFRAYDVTATTDGYLWFTHTSTVVRFDPSSGATLAYHPLGSDKAFQTIDADGDGNLWVADFNDRIYRLVAATGSSTSFEVPAATFPAGC